MRRSFFLEAAPDPLRMLQVSGRQGPVPKPTRTYFGGAAAATLSARAGNEWQDPDYLHARLTSGEAPPFFSLSEGESQAVALTVVR